MRGFLNIDKPQGVTSFDVVRRIRRAAGLKRVGHAGTLDPLATGVLPVAVGDATRLVDELMGARKRYRAEVLLGRETDTYDVDGTVLAERDASSLTLEAVRAAASAFEGEIMQAPPAFSAIKRGGEPAYRAARRGEAVAMAPRPVVAHAIEVAAVVVEGVLARVTLEIACGKGFYVRSLAHDLGGALGVGGTIAALRRLQVGPFRAEEAVPLARAAERLESGALEGLLLPVDSVLAGQPSAMLSEHEGARMRNGLSLDLSSHLPPDISLRADQVRCYGPGGEFIGVVRRSAQPGLWHPYRVFPRETS